MHLNLVLSFLMFNKSYLAILALEIFLITSCSLNQEKYKKFLTDIETCLGTKINSAWGGFQNPHPLPLREI